MESIFCKIDEIIANVNSFKHEPLFSQEVALRNYKSAPATLTQSQLLQIYIALIAFSQQANSKLVQELVDADIFREIFANYNVDHIVNMNPCDLVDQYWSRISAIRKQTKLFQIIMFARVLKRNPSVIELLTNPEIPKRITFSHDIETFWRGFNKLQKELVRHKVPFLRETTTLLHFLMEIGYDCNKPDSVVMGLSKKLGIVSDVKGDINFRKAVKCIQLYSLEKSLRPAVVDLYFLIAGKQKGAVKFVSPSYYTTKINFL
jgi:hypothetical protein